MANKKIAGIRTYLLTQLQTLLPAGTNKLQDVQKGRDFIFAGFPAAHFFSDGFQSVLEDQQSHWRTYPFVVEVFMPEANQDKAAIEDLLEDAMEAIMDAIEVDYTLGGAADNCEINVGKVEHVDTPFGVASVMRMQIEAKVLISF
jgi:hypothetical protein